MFEWHHILDFWFGPMDADGLPDKFHRDRWFRSSRAFDKEVRRRYLSMMLVASEGGLDSWRQAPGGRLSEILLLDQITRHVHRGSAMAFDNDRVARILCREGVEQGADIELPLIGRAFFYMPLEHSEKPVDQEESVRLYQQLMATAPEGRARDVFSDFYRSACEHRDIIARFGRFPHRNKVLKRASTEPELEFLRAGGQDFGQGPAQA